MLLSQEIELENLRPDQIWNLVIRHYDPENKWHRVGGSLHSIVIQPDGALVNEDIILNNQFDIYQSFLFRNDSIFMSRKEGRRISFSINGSKDISSEDRFYLKMTSFDIDFRRRRHLFELGMPMYLKEAGILFNEEVKEGLFNGENCIVLESVGTRAENKKRFPHIQSSIFYYIRPQDFSLAGMEFPEVIENREIPGFRIVFTGELDMNGVIIPRVKTYYRYLDNKYLYTRAVHPFTRKEFVDQEVERQVIADLLRDEIHYFQMRDFGKWISCWSQQDDVFQSYVSKNSYVINEGWAEIQSFGRSFFRENPDPHVISIDPYKLTFHIYDDLAWVYFDSRLKSQLQGRHQRILRKENGRWKIINWTCFDEASYVVTGLKE